MSRHVHAVVLAAFCAAWIRPALAARVGRASLGPSVQLVKQFPALKTVLPGQLESLAKLNGRLPGPAPVPTGEELVRQIALELIERRAVVLKDPAARAILGPDTVRSLRAVRKRRLELPSIAKALDLGDPKDLREAQERLNAIYGEKASGADAPMLVAASQAGEVWRRLPRPRPMPKAVEKGFAPVNGIELYYAVYGRGEPLVLLHGGLANSDYWGGQVRALAKSHKVVVVDSRGHGRSSRTDQPYSYGLMTSDVLALLDHLKLSKVSVAGWSDGGIIGLYMAIHHPERLERLFAFGANYDLSGLREGSDKDPVFKAYVARAAEEYARLSRTPRDHAAFLAAVSAMWASEPNLPAERLRAIDAPVAVVQAEFDEAIERGHAVAMAGLIKDSTLMILRGVSHFAMLQDPRRFNKALLDFLAAR